MNVCPSCNQRGCVTETLYARPDGSLFLMRECGHCGFSYIHRPLDEIQQEIIEGRWRYSGPPVA